MCYPIWQVLLRSHSWAIAGAQASSEAERPWKLSQEHSPQRTTRISQEVRRGDKYFRQKICNGKAKESWRRMVSVLGKWKLLEDFSQVSAELVGWWGLRRQRKGHEVTCVPWKAFKKHKVGSEYDRFKVFDQHHRGS